MNKTHTAEFIARVRALWLAGQSITYIGNYLGVSRNVVVGIAHRNGFPPRQSPIKRGASGPHRRVA